MDRNGHERVRQAAARAGSVVRELAPGIAAVRFLTAQVSGTRPEGLLNALDTAGLMSSVDGPRDDIVGPQLQVVASSNDYITFEDLNFVPSSNPPQSS